MSSDNSKNLFVKGLNFGSYSLSENCINFKGDSKDWFKIPLDSLSNVQQGSNKNELTLEFNKEEDNEDSALCELRLFVPDNEKKKDEKEIGKDNEKENKNNEDENKEEEEQIIQTKGEELKEKLLKMAKLESISDSIAHIPGIKAVTPRGKSDIFFMHSLMKIHGQSHNYQILNKNILKVFLLPKTDGPLSYLILKLKSPLTQGNTQYPFLIFEIRPDNEIEVEVNIPENDEQLKNKFEEIGIPLKGSTIDVFSHLFENIVGRNIIIPPKKSNFKKGPYIKCSYKANDGVLYFLEKTFLFVHKPVLDIEFDTIKEINLSRIHESGMQQRSFDMTIKLKKGEYQFSGLDREEIENIQEYIKAKKIKINSVDEDNNNVELPNYSTRRRAPVDEVVPELPSEDELGDDDYSASSEGNAEDDDDDDEDEEEEEEDKKKKKKNKKKKEKNEDDE